MEHVAIDLGRPNSVKCEMGVDGKKVMLRFRLTRKRLDDLFGDRPPCRVLIESSTDSEWVALHLEGLAHEVIVADPNYAAMYGERNRKVKTDNRDAAALFDANRLGIYREAYRRSSDQRRVIGQLRIRMSLVRTRTRWINVVRALLRGDGHQVPSGSAESFARRVREMEVPDDVRSMVQPLLDLMAPLNEQLARLDREVAALAQTDSRVALLQTAPMVGSITSAGFVALVDDVTRFHRAHDLESYLGLVPGERSSSEKRLRLGITKRGDSLERWLLVEAGWSILRSRRVDCFELRRWAEAIAARGGKDGKKIAAVALARRFAGILYAMLRDNKPFDPTQIGDHSRRKAA